MRRARQDDARQYDEAAETERRAGLDWPRGWSLSPAAQISEQAPLLMLRAMTPAGSAGVDAGETGQRITTMKI